VPIAAVLVDSGPLYACVDADDRHHAEPLGLLRSHPGPLLVPALVVTEVACLLGSRLGAEAEVRFLGDLAGGDFAVEGVAAGDWLRIAELVWHYRGLPLGTVDASVIAAAERLGIGQVVTLDRRHFAAVRPGHCAPLDLLP